MNFRDIGLAEPLLRAVLNEGYSVATPIQAQAIPTVLKGHDVIGIAQTGTGKTAAFALPILHRLLEQPPAAKGVVRPVRVLVLASTRELAVQIHESFTNYGAFAALRIATIYGGVGQQPQVTALRRGVDIVVATPGRLLDLIKQGYVDLKGLQTLVLDEADRMLDMGFFPAIRRVLEYVPRKRQTLMFSATMKPEIRDLANSILTNPVSISIEPKQKTTELVDQSVCFVPQKHKTRLLIELLQIQNPSRAIVFSRTKHGADRIVRHLVQAGFKSEAIHANKSQNKRQRTLEMFKSQSPPVLVATDIAARGIDVDLVSHVYLHDMPTEEETYIHRIGRSGRAGKTGIAVSLCDAEERRMLRSIEKLIGMKIDVMDVPGFEMSGDHSETSDSDRSDGGHRSGGGRQGTRGRGDRSPRDSQSAGRGRAPQAQRLHPIQAARAEKARHDRVDGGDRPAPNVNVAANETTRRDQGSDRNVRGAAPRGQRPGGSDRRKDQSEPGRKDLGRSAERQGRAAPHRQDRPVSNTSLRHQPRPQDSGTTSGKRSSEQTEFGEGVEFDNRAAAPGPERRRQRRRPAQSNPQH